MAWACSRISIDRHGTEGSDTAWRCAAAAHTIATVVAGDLQKILCHQIALPLGSSGLDAVATCYGPLVRSGTPATPSFELLLGQHISP